MKKIFALKGNICYSKNLKEIVMIPAGYVVCKEGKSAGAFAKLPEEYQDIEIIDYKDALIFPGMVDLHMHASQFVFRALGLDMELLEWLELNTFPQEAKYEDEEYALAAYELFVEDILKGPNTRVNLFATLHVPATIILMELIERSGIIANIGKVNMDRNAPEYLCEKNAGASAADTVLWLETIKGRFKNATPILTPRFIPSCSDELMGQLSDIQKKYGLPLQSHLSENLSEIDWVKALAPDTSCYGDAYDKYGLFGGGCKTVMAHCIHCSDTELDLIKNNGVFIAHCPQSNANLSSGIAPVRKYIDRGLKMGLGSDIAGGHTTSILRAMADSIQQSKLYWRLVDNTFSPLKLEEAFYLATAGGGEFFGKVGSFAIDYEFDAVVLDDSAYHKHIELSIKERLERAVYLSDDRHIKAKYIQGKKVK